MSDYYIPIVEAENKTRLLLYKITIAREKFPDAAVINWKDPTNYRFNASDTIVSDSIYKEKELGLKFSGVLHNLSVRIFYTIKTDLENVNVFSKENYIDLCNFDSFTDSSKLRINWLGADKKLKEMGLDYKYIKIIYGEVLKRITNPDTDMKIKVDTFPKYIVEKLPFI